VAVYVKLFIALVPRKCIRRWAFMKADTGN